MWGLFTRALTLASSTVRVSVINTSANFVITALLSLMIFSEKLPGLWWLGAALLVAGSVIIGRREEDTKGVVETTAGVEPLLDGRNGEGVGEGVGPFKDDEDEDGERMELNSVKDGDESASADEGGVLK